MDKRKYDEFILILKEELIPAMGCTEPIAVAYAAALAANALGTTPQKVTTLASANIIKNVKSVFVPNTGGMRGISAAAAAGIVSGDCGAELQILAKLKEEDHQKIEDLLENAAFSFSRSAKPFVFDIEVIVEADGHTARVEIAGHHTNVILIEKDGVPILQRREEFLENMNAVVNSFHQELTDHKEDLQLSYHKNVEETAFADTLAAGMEKELAQKMSLIGPHRDDFRFLIHGENVRIYGSQGQTRSAALALK